MKIVLGAKNKLGFVNAKIEAPEEGSEGFERWKGCDYMVASWLWNSIAKDLVGGFLYATSLKELWDEISERFGGSNGPMIYQIKRRISLLMQDGLSITSYYTKLKELWYELENIRVILSCTCGSVKISTEVDNCDKLMQFLMGLNGAYDQDQKTKAVVAIGKEHEGLYILDKSSFLSSAIQFYHKVKHLLDSLALNSVNTSFSSVSINKENFQLFNFA
ncbi:hypothetical protein GH714_024280 [Hevea brasiliensis]|uniref:Uncharacterized protein n=1 Tax=Hevea brasiliensis TaxID=3981 RepID=A0A6A6LE78_HEVBR|nr:hypothetical protein GH714_024280 [Hevea brasiliensis]